MNSGGGRASKEANVRASGFYWIRVPEGAVVVGRWIDITQSWLLAGWDGFLEDGEVTVVSARLEPPS